MIVGADHFFPIICPDLFASDDQGNVLHGFQLAGQFRFEPFAFRAAWGILFDRFVIDFRQLKDIVAHDDSPFASKTIPWARGRSLPQLIVLVCRRM